MSAGTTHRHIVPLFIEFSFCLTFDFCLVAVSLTTLTKSATEKGVNCRRLKDQLDTLERETTDKLAQMEQYNKELKVSETSAGYGVCLINILPCIKGVQTI